LARLLKNGTPFPDAAEAVPGVFRDEDALAIRFGAQSGTLAATLREALEDRPALTPGGTPRLRRAIDYFATIFIVGSLIVAFIQIKIQPAFRKIFSDFNFAPPAIGQTVWSINAAFLHYWYVVLLAVLLFLWFTFSARPGRILRRSFLGRIIYPLHEFGAADVLQQLSMATAAGRPMAGALSTLARYHFDPTVRNKLLFVRNEAEQGADVWESMATAGLVTQPEVRVLKSAERLGNRPWALKQLAAAKKRRTARRIDRLSQFALPLVVLLLGSVVLFQALSVFIPITQFIEHLL
jgi:type II secretory pathway component PulF